MDGRELLEERKQSANTVLGALPATAYRRVSDLQRASHQGVLREKRKGGGREKKFVLGDQINARVRSID